MLNNVKSRTAGRALKTTLILTALLTVSIFAQETKIELPTADSSSSFTVTGTDTDRMMKFFADGGFYVSGDINLGTIPKTGAGTRMMFYPKKGAFRVGATGTQWDDANIGAYSTAMGYSTTASENTSTAMGYQTRAIDITSTTFGWVNVSSGIVSTAIGRGNVASGFISTAMGGATTASGNYSIAMGWGTTASGEYSTAMGYSTTASGDNSTAIGNNVSTNGKLGSLAIGDNSNSAVLNAYANNMMIARFIGGYTFYSNSTLNAGVTVPGGGNAWASASDSTKKENVRLADGEYFLKSISKLRLGSWNYKGQNPKIFRHYGPMAQEIFHYFGKDEYGTIGCDTLLATADMDGIMMIAIQALEKRTRQFQIINKQLKIEQALHKEFEKTNENLEARFAKLEKIETKNNEMETRLAKLEEMVNEILSNNETIEVATK